MERSKTAKTVELAEEQITGDMEVVKVNEPRRIAKEKGKVVLVASGYIVLSSSHGNMWRVRTPQDKDVKVGDSLYI